MLHNLMIKYHAFKELICQEKYKKIKHKLKNKKILNFHNYRKKLECMDVVFSPLVGIRFLSMQLTTVQHQMYSSKQQTISVNRSDY